MTAGTLRQAAEVLCMLAVAGCNRPAATETGVPTPARALVFYDDTGSPSEHAPALSESELDRIAESIKARTSEPVWFVRVKPSGVEGERGTVIAYLAPQQQTPRVREGLAYSIWMPGQEMSISSPWEYIQISVPGQMFPSRLDLPSTRDLPFLRPTTVARESNSGPPLTVDEMIRIADLLRLPASYADLAIRRTVPDEAEGQRPYELPILYMRRDADTIRVQFGFQHASLFGYGQYVTLEQTPSGYKITKWGIWIS